MALLTLQRPEKKNALSIALRDEVSDHLDGLAGDEDVKVVMFTGSGDTFSAGFDLREFTSEDPGVQEALWPSSDRYHHAVLRFPLPTIVAVNGPALAGGFDLAVMCDVRVASEAAAFAHRSTPSAMSSTRRSTTSSVALSRATCASRVVASTPRRRSASGW